MNRIFFVYYKRTILINLMITLFWTLFGKKDLMSLLMNFLVTFNLFGFLFSQVYEKFKFSGEENYYFFYNKGFDKKKLIVNAIKLNGIISLMVIGLTILVKIL